MSLVTENLQDFATVSRRELNYLPQKEQKATARKPQGRWGLIDQGIVSSGNFASALLCARFLSRPDFGRFALLFDIILLLNGFTAAAICYPLSVKGAGMRAGKLRRYVTASVALTAVCLLPLACVNVIAASLIAGNIWGGVCATFGLIGWQLQETTRRGLMSQLRFADAIWGDAISYPGQAISLLALGLSHRLTLETGFIAVGITSGMGFILQWIQIGFARVRLYSVLRIGQRFWTAGRWMVLTSLASVPTIQAVSWTLAAFAGVGVVGEYMAIVALLRIANPVISGLGSVITPSAARARTEFGIAAAWQVTLRHAIQGAALLMPYYLILLAIPHQVLALVYGHDSAYLHDAGALRLYVAANVLFYFAQMLLIFMAAIEQTHVIFWTQTCSTAVTILISLPLTALFGLYGVVGGVAISILVRFLAAVISFRSLNWAELDVGLPRAALLSQLQVPTAA